MSTTFTTVIWNQRFIKSAAHGELDDAVRRMRVRITVAAYTGALVPYPGEPTVALAFEQEYKDVDGVLGWRPVVISPRRQVIVLARVVDQLGRGTMIDIGDVRDHWSDEDDVIDDALGARRVTPRRP